MSGYSYKLEDPKGMVKEYFSRVTDEFSLKIARMHCDHVLMFTKTEDIDDVVDLISALDEKHQSMIEVKNENKTKH